MLGYLLLLATAAQLGASANSLLGNRSCSESEFQCLSGKCLPKSWLCDNEQDCENGEDEKDCTKTKCMYNQFECEIGNCIPDTWVCDGQDDCLKGADEANCSRSCRSDQFTCKSNGWCVQSLWVCDGDYDCADNSDELDCPTVHCKNNEFSCDERHCISDKWRCDGDYDCLDRTDEQGCASAVQKIVLCHANEYLCGDLATCIPLTWLCDGTVDCPNHDDESHGCSEPQCRPDQFKCRNNHCISGHLYCNGIIDCLDLSDEDNCTVVSVKGCKNNEFQCRGNMCIPMNKTCDGHIDCPNGEDEPVGKCHVNECQINNGGCTHKCFDTTLGYHCSCNSGFKLVSNYSCEDINECDNPGTCSHICINEIGSFKCECFEGYTKDPSDRTRCKPTDGHTYLLFTRKHDIRQLYIDYHEMYSVINDTKSSAGLDFVFKTGTIFWSDLSENKIYKASIGDTSRTSVMNHEIVSCDGLAVDWIYDHIYWTDTGKNTIEVANLDGTMKKTLFDTGLDEPRAIVVNPLDGWMYWSDWGEDARIEKGGLDGSHRHVIVSFDIKWPNGLALDLSRQKLYWVDAKLKSISSINYDGSERTVILKSAETLHHPFSISVFEDSIYWTDWQKSEIFQANKFNGENITSLTDGKKIQNLMVVHAYHPLRQPSGMNFCSLNNSMCSHLCLPAPQINSNAPKISCACPDGFRITPDGLQCTEEVKSTSQPDFPHRYVIVAGASAHHKGPFSKEAAIPIVILCALAFLAFTSIIAYAVYKNYLQKNVTRVNYDNPVYRKTTEDNFSLNKSCPKPANINEISDEIRCNNHSLGEQPKGFRSLRAYMESGTKRC